MIPGRLALSRRLVGRLVLLYGIVFGLTACYLAKHNGQYWAIVMALVGQVLFAVLLELRRNRKLVRSVADQLERVTRETQASIERSLHASVRLSLLVPSSDDVLRVLWRSKKEDGSRRWRFLPTHRTLAGRAYLEGHEIVVGDWAAAKLGTECDLADRARSMVAVPLKRDQQVIGVVCLDSERSLPGDQLEKLVSRLREDVSFWKAAEDGFKSEYLDSAGPFAWKESSLPGSGCGSRA
ncbi:MAG: GAF domain-containing protein [Verrucomicrobia bacterium]|nr:GAF domain-containing protein [Verrucomicrobiota bacterium]